jgi:large subunit ribosomal protein L27
MGKDHTLFATAEGRLVFSVKGVKQRRTLSVVPA